MSDNKNNIGKIKIFLQRDFFNSLVSVLSSFIAADEKNKYSVYAQKLKDTLLKHSRKIIRNDDENAMICLYEDEAALLIKLSAIYFNATGNYSEDFFSQIGKRSKL
jgi:hypothetical protein